MRISDWSSAVCSSDLLLQGETDRAGNTAQRFAINSTIGVLGLYDAADNWFGIAQHTEDLGQTLATWGVDEGPYQFIRSEESRVWKEWVCTCRSRGWQEHYKKKKNNKPITHKHT